MMGPLEEIQKAEIMELVRTLKPFAVLGNGGTSHHIAEARRVVVRWEYAFKKWGWMNDSEKVD